LDKIRKDKVIPEILFLSNMMAEKGVFNFLKACKILNGKAVKFKAIFVGEWIDIKESDFNEFVVSNGIQENVLYEGKKFGEEKSAYLKTADIFIHPTLNDCFPLTILEAMQYGLPVISTLEGGIPDIVDDGTTGLLVQKQDLNGMSEKITMLLGNQEMRKAMGAKGQIKFNKKYTLELFEQNIKGVIDKILNEK
jgi:glycosyltransferase involved in cell wall biosynthesis